jgi:TrmH family RNA methyltransferase
VILTHAQRRRIERIARGRSEEALFVLEGPRAVRDALAGGFVVQVWLRRDLAPDLGADLRERAAAAGVPVGEADRDDFERLGRTVTPQGVLALVRDTGLPLGDLAPRPGLLLWLDGVQDPGNVGAVVRVAAAFGAAGVLASTSGAHPLGLKALRASAGLALGVPFARAPAGDVAAALRARSVPVWLLAREGDDVQAVQAPPEDLVLVVGSEGHGPGPEARALAVRRVGIRMAAGVDSLNAAVAVGIAVAALCRSGRPDATP